MTKYSDNDIRLRDITRESASSFWSALLTVNGILVAVFSVTSVSENFFGLLLIFISIISAGLIVLNFKDQLSFYRFLGRVEDMPDEQKQMEQQRILSQRNNILRRESVVIRFLYLQAILILLLFAKKIL